MKSGILSSFKTSPVVSLNILKRHCILISSSKDVLTTTYQNKVIREWVLNQPISTYTTYYIPSIFFNVTAKIIQLSSALMKENIQFSANAGLTDDYMQFYEEQLIVFVADLNCPDIEEYFEMVCFL